MRVDLGVRPQVTAGRPAGAVLRTVRETAFVTMCTLVVSLTVKALLVQLFVVPSESMTPTLAVGDKLAVLRPVADWRSVRRGDVVVFRDPGGWLPRAPAQERSRVAKALEFVGMIPYHSGEHLVKRVVAEAGDTVECRGKGPVYLNGWPLDEPYLPETTTPCRTTFTVVVPARSIWVMGDNRDNSADSRYHMTGDLRGAVPVDSIAGRVVTVAWPPTRWGAT